MPRALAIGSLSRNNETARSWVEPKRDYPIPQCVHAATVDWKKHPLRASLWNTSTQPGSMDAYRLPSRGGF